MNRRSFIRVAAGVAAAFGLGPAVRRAGADEAEPLACLTRTVMVRGLATATPFVVPAPPGLYVQTWDVHQEWKDAAIVTVRYGSKPLTRTGSGYFDVTRFHCHGYRRVFLDGRDVTCECDEMNADEGWVRLLDVAERHPDGLVKRITCPVRRFISWGRVELKR